MLMLLQPLLLGEQEAPHLVDDMLNLVVESFFRRTQAPHQLLHRHHL